MEISGKILREVEFRDRLRGYDTDEVDEFLEKVAVGVDELREEVAGANGRAERAEKQLETLPPGDDDAIRRTLVLAQRTADLAVSEAREEANRILEQARTQSDTMVAEARQIAQAMRSDAERDLESRVEHLGEAHDRLTRQLGVLSTLIEGERARVTESLHTLLGYVEDTLKVPQQVAEAAEMPGLEPEPYPGPPSLFKDPDPYPPATEVQRAVPSRDDPLDLGLPDVEAEIGEDAALAFTSAGRELSDHGAQPSELDPDEELWSRWASGAGEDAGRDAGGLGAGPRDEGGSAG